MAHHHQASANLVSIVVALALHDGWLSTAEVAKASAVHRDTCRKILVELKLADWAAHTDSDGTDRWRLGVALPRLGLQYQMRLLTKQRELQREWKALTEPIRPLLSDEGEVS